MTKGGVETIIQNNKVIYKGYFDVPTHLAFEAWSTPEHLSQWWGPDGFTLTTKSIISPLVEFGNSSCMALTAMTIKTRLSL